MPGLKVMAVHNRYLMRGGEDEVFESEARLLQEHGNEVRLVTEDMTYPESLTHKIETAANAIWSCKWHEKLLDQLRVFRPDVVHVHNLFPVMSPSLYYACRESNVPVVQTLHNYRLFCPRATCYREGRVCQECLDHSLWRGVRYGCYKDSHLGSAATALMLAIHRWRKTWTEAIDYHVALTEFSRRKFISAGIPAEKIVVKPNFVERDPGRRRDRGSYSVFVGRLSREKGLATLFSAWERLPQEIPLWIVGDGPMRAELEERLASQNLLAACFRGRLEREQVVRAMQGARFLIFPSEWYETFGMSIIESFACGVPVICSRLGAMREIVEDGQTGLHFTPGDAEDLAEKVHWAWNHPEELERMGEAARKEYETKYTPEKNYSRLMEIYHQAISRSTSAAA